MTFSANVLQRGLAQKRNVGLSRGELLGTGLDAESKREKKKGFAAFHQLLGLPASIQAENWAMEQESSFPDCGINRGSPGFRSILSNMISANIAMSACASNPIPAEGAPPE